MKKFNFKSLLALGVALFIGAPVADAWTAQELVDFCGGYGTEVVGSYANQNSLATISRPVNVFKSQMSNGTEVFVIKNFLGNFQVEFTVSGNTITAYNSEGKSYTTTNRDNVSINGKSVRYLNLNRVVIADIKQAYDNYWGTVYGVHLDRTIDNNGNGYNYSTVSQLRDIVYNCNVAVASIAGVQQSNLTRIKAGLPAEKWQGEITEDEYGNVVLLFHQYNSFSDNTSIQLDYLNANGYSQGYDIMDTYVVTLYKKNTDITYTNKGTETTYPAGVITDKNKLGDYDFGIVNFHNIGSTYANFNVNGQIIGSVSQSPYYEYDIVKGYINGNKVTIPSQYAFAALSGRMNAYNGPSILSNVNYKFFGFDPETQQPRADFSITGTIVKGDVPHHNDGHNTWVYTVNGGNLHTYIGGSYIKLDPYGFTGGGQTTSWGNRNEMTVIPLGGADVEYTFDCDPIKGTLTHKSTDYDFEVSKDYYRVNYSLPNVHNLNFVDKIEVYLVPEKHEHCSTVDHSKAVLIETLSADDFDEGDSYTCGPDRHKVYFDQLGCVWDDENKQYNKPNGFSMYARAIYKAAPASASAETVPMKVAPMLADSYHALASVGISDVPTGVVMETVKDITIEANEAGIIANGDDDAAVYVYDMSGALVAEGRTNETIALDIKGVFIVKVLDKVAKIVK